MTEATPATAHSPVVSVRNLRVTISGTPILRGVSFNLIPGKTLGVVGESGCGKTMTGLSLMGMLPATAHIEAESLLIAGQNAANWKEHDWLGVRGETVAMVMQDPFTSLNPMMRVGLQIAEAIRLHRGLGKDAALAEAVQWLHRVGVPNPEASARKFPHEMSGGQRQRIVIATAFACQPKVLIADEPTTALDVTLQAQILRLIRDLQTEHQTAVMLVTHDIGVVAAMADEVAVFYAGRIVETGPPANVLHHPQHPYTQALLASLPRKGQARLATISGRPPLFTNLPTGCAFAPRCPKKQQRCEAEPNLIPLEPGHSAACWLAEEQLSD